MYPLSVKPSSVPHSHAVNLLGPGLGFEPRKSVYATDVLPCIQFQSPCGGVESGRFVVIRTRPNLYCKTYWPCVDLLRLSALFITSGHVSKSVRPRSLRLCYLATLSRGTRPFSKRLLFLQWKTRNQSAHVSQKLSANCVTKPNEINCTTRSRHLQAFSFNYILCLRIMEQPAGIEPA